MALADDPKNNLVTRLGEFALCKRQDDTYLIFDCPGQVELFNMNDSFARILQTMTEQWNYRRAALSQLLTTSPTATTPPQTGAQ